MSRPQRIQRKRTKGWKMPENTIYVGRGSVFGNPFRIGYYEKLIGRPMNRQDCVDLFRRGLEAADALGTPFSIYHENQHELYMAWQRHTAAHPLPKRYIDLQYSADLAVLIETKTYELRGKNLACWCPLDQPCHADVLLEIANMEPRP